MTKIDNLEIVSANRAKEYMTRNSQRFNNMLRDAFVAGFRKGVELQKPTVVRCEDCKHWNKHSQVCSNDDLYRRINDCGCYPDFSTNPDWFCADGKRKDDGNDEDSVR